MDQKKISHKKSKTDVKRRRDDDYEIGYSRHSDAVIAIISLVCALLIWLYTVTAGIVVI